MFIKKPKNKLKGSFKTWLYTIGRNLAIDYLRKNYKRNKIFIDNYPELVNEEENLENSYIKQERKIAVLNALKKLKLEYRQILWLIYFEDFSSKQAATVMKKSVHNIETLVYRARKALKSQLETEGFTYEEL